MIKSFAILLLFLIGFGARGQNAEKEIKKFQEELNQEYKDPSKSPLTEEDFSSFNGLEFYPINLKFRVKAQWVPFDPPEYFNMATTTDRSPLYAKYGRLHFKIDGKAYQLVAYQSQDLKRMPQYKDYLFIPFIDETCGVESYGGGRYIEFHIPDGEEVILDFNQAYNPYCCYKASYSCPIPPEENYLELEIRAGVKAFEK